MSKHGIRGADGRFIGAAGSVKPQSKPAKPGGPSEDDVADKLKAGCKMRRVACLRITGMNGIPDYLVIVPGAVPFYLWVELKTDDGKVRDDQKTFHRALRKWGCHVVIARGYRGVKDVLDIIDTHLATWCER